MRVSDILTGFYSRNLSMMIEIYRWWSEFIDDDRNLSMMIEIFFFFFFFFLLRLDAFAWYFVSAISVAYFSWELQSTVTICKLVRRKKAVVSRFEFTRSLLFDCLKLVDDTPENVTRNRNKWACKYTHPLERIGYQQLHQRVWCGCAVTGKHFNIYLRFVSFWDSHLFLIDIYFRETRSYTQIHTLCIYIYIYIYIYRERERERERERNRQRDRQRKTGTESERQWYINWCTQI